MEDFSMTTFKMLDLKLIQIVLIVMTLIFTCYLLIKLILWTYDYLNTKYLNISSTRLTYLKTLIMAKTNIYLHLYDFTTGDSVNLYMEQSLETQKTLTVRDNLLQEGLPLTNNPLMISLI